MADGKQAHGRIPEFEKGDVRQRLLDALSGGNTIEASANYAGIGVSTVHQWTNRGTKALAKKAEEQELTPIEERYAEMTEAIRKAQASAEIRAVSLLTPAPIMRPPPPDGSVCAGPAPQRKSKPAKPAGSSRAKHPGAVRTRKARLRRCGSCPES